MNVSVKKSLSGTVTNAQNLDTLGFPLGSVGSKASLWYIVLLRESDGFSQLRDLELIYEDYIWSWLWWR